MHSILRQICLMEWEQSLRSAFRLVTALSNYSFSIALEIKLSVILISFKSFMSFLFVGLFGSISIDFAKFIEEFASSPKAI